MNREIKFRAWDNTYKCLYKPTHEAYKGNLFELLVGFSGDLNAHTMNGLFHESIWPDRFELMQHTGLKDKNDKEIYEGDIVIIPTESCDPADQGGKDILKVVFMNGMFVLIREDKPKWKPWIATLFDYEDDIEIIGNIYENPELLK
jgi:uncharacterized phage protein (TIGR01671 family)